MNGSSAMPGVDALAGGAEGAVMRASKSVGRTLRAMLSASEGGRLASREDMIFLRDL